MGEVISDLERHVIARAGHWVQQEHPEELNRLLVDWLNRRF
jgi:pimeloyl-ACP methyl ester carboxylesterase